MTFEFLLNFSFLELQLFRTKLIKSYQSWPPTHGSKPVSFIFPFFISHSFSLKTTCTSREAIFQTTKQTSLTIAPRDLFVNNYTSDETEPQYLTIFLRYQQHTENCKFIIFYLCCWCFFFRPVKQENWKNLSMSMMQEEFLNSSLGSRNCCGSIKKLNLFVVFFPVLFIMLASYEEARFICSSG